MHISPQIGILIVITVALPIAWLVADIRARAVVRRTLGVAAILWSFGIAALFGSLERFNSNAYFTSATKDLLDASVQQLRVGNSEVVLREWSRANDEFTPTYENRARYRKIVDQTVEAMKK